jgi:hypothetical protein
VACSTVNTVVRSSQNSVNKLKGDYPLQHHCTKAVQNGGRFNTSPCSRNDSREKQDHSYRIVWPCVVPTKDQDHVAEPPQNSSLIMRQFSIQWSQLSPAVLCWCYYSWRRTDSMRKVRHPTSCIQ